MVDTTDAPGSPDSSSSNDAIAGPSDAQSFQCGDQPPPSTWHNSFSSRKAALHDVVDADYEMYRSRLMAAPVHRCVKVADNARGVHSDRPASSCRSQNAKHYLQVAEMSTCTELHFCHGSVYRMLLADSDATSASVTTCAMQDQMLEHLMHPNDLHGRPWWHCRQARSFCLQLLGYGKQCGKHCWPSNSQDE